MGGEVLRSKGFFWIATTNNIIGGGMKKDVIQELLDSCLLTDQEMAMGPKEWKKNWADLDRFKLVLEESDDEDEEESEDDDYDSDGEKESKRMKMSDGRNDVKRMRISQ